MKNYKVSMYRFLLILVCFVVTVVCILQMRQSFDPLARYPYVTSENRDILLKYLDSDDIDYIVSQQMKPKVFMDFIEIPGFNIHNAVLYRTAMDTREETPSYIVNFVNRFKKNFSNKMLKDLLVFYSYVDLTTFYENEQVFQNELTLTNDPDHPYLILDASKTVYKYLPPNLVSYDNILVKDVMVNDLNDMNEAFMSTFGRGLIFESGYIGYETLYAKYGENLDQNPDLVSHWMFPAGQNEVQLGYTISLEGTKTWLESCILQQQSFPDYEMIEMNLDESLKIQLEWIQENAYRFGFVIRYPQGKEDLTKHWYQPFVLRYVGKETAKRMVDANVCMEETEFQDEIK